MERGLYKTSRILMWIGLILLGAMILTMIVFGFTSGMVAVAVMSLDNGGDPSPIFLIMEGVAFLWKMSFFLLLLSALLWALAHVARSSRINQQRRKYEEFQQMKDEIYSALETDPKFKLTQDQQIDYLRDREYVDLTASVKKPVKRSRRRR